MDITPAPSGTTNSSSFEIARLEAELAASQRRLAWAETMNASLDAANVRLIHERDMLRSALGVPQPALGPLSAPAGSDERLAIYLNTNITMSRGKAAAHAVHAALTAFGVHHGGPVIVLGSKPRDIEKMRVAIRDEGRTELTPGTLTAGTDWAPLWPAKAAQTQNQYRAVWPGGMVSSSFPSVIPLLEAFERHGTEPSIEKRQALFTPWAAHTVDEPTENKL